MYAVKIRNHHNTSSFICKLFSHGGSKRESKRGSLWLFKRLCRLLHDRLLLPDFCLGLAKLRFEPAQRHAVVLVLHLGRGRADKRCYITKGLLHRLCIVSNFGLCFLYPIYPDS